MFVDKLERDSNLGKPFILESTTTTTLSIGGNHDAIVALAVTLDDRRSEQQPPLKASVATLGDRP